MQIGPGDKTQLQLGFASVVSVNVHTTLLLGCSVLTQHHRGRQVLSSMLGQKFSLRYHRGSCRGPQKSGSRRKGMKISGSGGVSGRSLIKDNSY
jgi:hypothetical protein